MTSGPDDSQPQSPDPFPSFVPQIQCPDFLDPPQPPCLDDATRGQVAQALRDLLDIGSLFTGSPILAGLGLYQAWKVNEAGPPDDLSGGVLTGIVGNFLAPTIPMPGGQKLKLLYDRATVQPDAVQVGGVITGRVARTPLAAIGGRTSITFQPVQSVAEELFGLANLDDVLPPLRIAWTVDGQPAVEGGAITVKFDAPAPGTVEYEDVTVTVTDRNDLTATSTVRVQLVAPLADTDHGHHHGDGNPLQEP